METQPFAFERDRAYALLVALIFGMEVGEDEPLSERKLAEQLGIGRMPVREALRQLEQEGVVEVRPARGTFVRRPSTEELAETYRVREALEGLAAELAAIGGASPAVAACGARMRAMARHPESFSAREIDDAGTDFHEALTRASGNRVLQDTIRMLRRRSRLAFHLPRYFPDPVLRETLAQHVEIYEAVAAREPERAGALMRDHLRRGLALRLALDAESRLAQDRRSPNPKRRTTG